MKIDINKVKQIPKEVASKFGVCVYGEPAVDILKWIYHHNFEVEKVGPYTNVYIGKDLSDVFLPADKFQYMDGFSPNMNKHLHVGHLSNLVLAKAFVGMKVANGTVAILGDTLEGEVSKEEALEKFKWYCDTFGYSIDKLYFASAAETGYEMEPGEGKYEGTEVFNVGGEYIVGKKSDGSTTYFYQDVALAEILDAPTLYLTGHEQNQHFAKLKEMFNGVHHLGIGLVKAGQAKMSSRIGNVIMAQQLIDLMMDKFGDHKVVYNIIAGHILKAAPKSDKNIDLAFLDNPLNSQGLYLSYTLAKVKSAGATVTDNDNFVSKKLQFKLLKAQHTLSPNVLFEELVEHAKWMSSLYETHQIKGDEENTKVFSVLASDLALGLKKLGMFEIDKV